MKKILPLLVIVITCQASLAQTRTYILVHGGWQGAWCWNKIIPLLETNGHKAIAFDLPGHGSDKIPAENVTLADYVRKVVEVSNEVKGPVILVGHSMSGVIIAQAAEDLGPKKVQRLIFIDAFMPKTGESVFSLAGKAEAIGDQKGRVLPNLEMSGDQATSAVKIDAVQSLFYEDCSEEDVAFAKEHLGKQPMAPLAASVKVTDSRYGAIPKHYVLCTKANDLDKTSIATNVPIEKLFKLESGHSPFISMPDKLVAVLMK